MRHRTLFIVLFFIIFAYLIIHVRQLWKISVEASPSVLGRSSTDGITTKTKNKYGVTLVTQTSAERLWLLRETCQRWKSPIIVVLYVPFIIEEVTEKDFLKIQQKDGSYAQLGTEICTNVEIIIFKSKRRTQDNFETNYPINKLRNIGIAAVKTSHFLLIDVDFWPSNSLDSMLSTYSSIDMYHDLMYSNLNAFVVPAFKLLPIRPGCPTVSVCKQSYQKEAPKDFSSLQNCLRRNTCQVLHLYEKFTMTQNKC